MVRLTKPSLYYWAVALLPCPVRCNGHVQAACWCYKGVHLLGMLLSACHGSRAGLSGLPVPFVLT